MSPLKNSQNIFIQLLTLYTSCVFPILLFDDIVDNEKPCGICWLTFVWNYKNVYDVTKIFSFHITFYEIHVFFLVEKNEDNSDNKNTSGVWTLLVLIMLILLIFLLQANDMLLYFELFKKITWVSRFELCFEK